MPPHATMGSTLPHKYRALFLDRDGVININHGYVHRIADFEFIDGIFDLAHSAHKYGYKIVIITNQAGIARGYYSEAQFHELTRWMCLQFESNCAPIAQVYFSPFHPEGLGEYRKDDDTRKPRPGMILRAREELGISLVHSVLIGDQPSDIQAGQAAGVGMNILFSANPNTSTTCQPHAVIGSLTEAISFLQPFDNQSLICA